MRAKLALVLHLGGVGKCGRLIWVWSVQAQESGDLQGQGRGLFGDLLSRAKRVGDDEVAEEAANKDEDGYGGRILVMTRYLFGRENREAIEMVIAGMAPLPPPCRCHPATGRGVQVLQAVPLKLPKHRGVGRHCPDREQLEGARRQGLWPNRGGRVAGCEQGASSPSLARVFFFCIPPSVFCGRTSKIIGNGWGGRSSLDQKVRCLGFWWCL